jgi:hypothetical protein
MFGAWLDLDGAAGAADQHQIHVCLYEHSDWMLTESVVSPRAKRHPVFLEGKVVYNFLLVTGNADIHSSFTTYFTHVCGK